MRALLLILVISSAVHVQAGEAPYNAGGNCQKAEVRYQYFCQADSADGKLYLTKPKFAFQGKYDQNLVANIETAWTDYVNKIYDRRNVRYPHCEFAPNAQVDGTYQSVVTGADSLHRKVVHVDWQFTTLLTSP